MLTHITYAKGSSSPQPSPPPAATGAKLGESAGGEGESRCVFLSSSASCRAILALRFSVRRLVQFQAFLKPPYILRRMFSCFSLLFLSFLGLTTRDRQS